MTAEIADDGGFPEILGTGFRPVARSADCPSATARSGASRSVQSGPHPGSGFEAGGALDTRLPDALLAGSADGATRAGALAGLNDDELIGVMRASWPISGSQLRSAGPLCRRHHRCKQAQGWRLDQPSPGIMHWTISGGRRYATYSSDARPADADPQAPRAASVAAFYSDRLTAVSVTAVAVPSLLALVGNTSRSPALREFLTPCSRALGMPEARPWNGAGFRYQLRRGRRIIVNA